MRMRKERERGDGVCGSPTTQNKECGRKVGGEVAHSYKAAAAAAAAAVPIAAAAAEAVLWVRPRASESKGSVHENKPKTTKERNGTTGITKQKALTNKLLLSFLFTCLKEFHDTAPPQTNLFPPYSSKHCQRIAHGQHARLLLAVVDKVLRKVKLVLAPKLNA